MVSLSFLWLLCNNGLPYCLEVYRFYPKSFQCDCIFLFLFNSERKLFAEEQNCLNNYILLFHQYHFLDGNEFASFHLIEINPA